MRDQDFVYGGGLVTERGLRQMTRWGLIVLAMGALVLMVWGMVQPEPYAHGWWLVVELFTVGRVVCAYDGVRLGFSKAYLLFQGGAQDIGFFLLVFPLVIRFYERVSSNRYVDKVFGAVTRAAERNRDRIQGYGTAGLFLFAFFPASGTGTLVGCMVGYLLGVRARLAVPVVIAGHLLCLVFLLAFFEWLEPVLRSMNEGFAEYFAWLFLAVLVVAGWLYNLLKKRLARSGTPVRSGIVAPAEGAE